MVRVRRVVGVAGGVLVASLMVPVGLAGPAGAEPGCVDETVPTDPLLGLPTGDGCDDDTPPDTTLSASATPNANGLLATSSVTFTMQAVVGDHDPGPFALECRLSGPAQSHDWRPCTSPTTYSGLSDAAAGSYTFSARAVDTADRDRNPDANPALPPAVADVPDHDPTPASMTWGQDTAAPYVFLTPDTYDDHTPTQPVVTGRRVLFRINSNEPGSTFECTDNGEPVACTGGRWTLRGASSGRHRFVVRALDPAGNASAWSVPAEFFVPTNLTKRMSRHKGWRKARVKRAFDRDVLVGRQRGLRLVLPRTTVGELRLYASTAPSYGKVRVRVGRRDWHVIDLAGPRRASKEFWVFDRYSGTRRGRVVIETVGPKRVVLDAVVARPNRFPDAAPRAGDRRAGRL